MRLVNSPKMIFEEYWQKYEDDRKKFSDNIKAFLDSFEKSVLPLIYQPYKWLFVVPFLALSTVFFTVLVILSSLISFRRGARFFAVSWARVNSFFTPMAVEVIGYENIDPTQSYVVVANHQSLYDIYVLYGWIGIDFKWVMKKELEKVPALGAACKTLGHIFIDRSDTKSAIESINAAKEKIVNGTSVLFFPEGSRSADGKIGPFKKGAFKLALELGIPILPITLSGTGRILPKGSLNLTPGSATMLIHPPVSVQGFTEKNMKKLIVHTRSVIISGLHK